MEEKTTQELNKMTPDEIVEEAYMESNGFGVRLWTKMGNLDLTEEEANECEKELINMLIKTKINPDDYYKRWIKIRI